MRMTHTLHTLQTATTQGAAEIAKRHMAKLGLSPKEMSEWTHRPVLLFLNQGVNPLKNRIKTVVESCRRVIELTEQIRASSASRKKALCDERDQVLVYLNARLAKHKWHPVVRARTSPYTNFDIDVHYEFAKSDSAHLENQAVRWLMNHIDVVHRIRPCHRRECGEWFFAKTDHQKYCGERCRRQDAAHGEVFKEKRRLYMKKYRRAEAERNAQAERLVKGNANEHLQAR